MKIPKNEIKKQRDIYNKISTGSTFTEEFTDYVYEEFNPAIADNLSENGTYFTPYGLAQDFAAFAPRRGHVVDMCAGIGMLTYRLSQMDSYDKDIESLTCIELNPKFVEIGKKLIPQANWICADAYDKVLWDDLVKNLPDKRFDLIISNPPFGYDQNDKDKYNWLNFTGQRDLMAVEIGLRYAKWGYFILPSGSSPFSYSGRPYYVDEPDRYSQKIKRFFKANQEFAFDMSCDGIDCDVHRQDWKNLPGGIGVEVVNMPIYPWSMYDKEDSILKRERFSKL